MFSSSSTLRPFFLHCFIYSVQHILSHISSSAGSTNLPNLSSFGSLLSASGPQGQRGVHNPASHGYHAQLPGHYRVANLALCLLHSSRYCRLLMPGQKQFIAEVRVCTHVQERASLPDTRGGEPFFSKSHLDIYNITNLI